MKKTLPLFFFLLILLIVSSPANAQDFAWIKGTTTTNQQGFYGVAGTPNAGNTPGSRSGACSWKDAAGKYWLFGGRGYDNGGNFDLLNDLWKYDPANNQWTWYKGDVLIGQIGNYGTMGVAASTNKPGARTNAVSWIDLSGNVWLFGGFGYDGVSSLGYLNDLWKYDPTSNQWTWMGGSSTPYPVGNYGSITIPSSSNVPGSRSGAIGWADGNGNLWLFGGLGYGASPIGGHLNDIWRYNILTNMWTWMKGSSSVEQLGAYGTLGTPAFANCPGGRKLAQNWKDLAGNFWLLGGFGRDNATPAADFLNDLWKYDLTTNEWTWINGSNTVFQNGFYGTQGVASNTNVLGSRMGGITWVDGTGSVWLFGGEGVSGAGNATGKLNDLWTYKPGPNQWTWMKGSSALGQNGSYGSQGTFALTNRPGGRSEAVSWIDSGNDLWLFGGDGFATAVGTQGRLNDVWKYKNCSISPITMTIVAKDSVLCAGQSTSLTVSGSNNYLWVHNLSTAPSVVLTVGNTNTVLTVLTSDAKGCIYNANFTETVSACASINGNTNSANDLRIYPNPSDGKLIIQMETIGEVELVLRNYLGQIVLREVLNTNFHCIETGLPPGIYTYEMNGDRCKPTGKLVIH